MTYETKVLLTAIAQVIRKADSLEEVYDAVEEMANVEGLMLRPYSKEKGEKDKKEE